MKQGRMVLAAGVLLVGGLLLTNNYRGQVSGISTSAEDKKITGIILPHHDLARELIITSLDKIDEQYKLIFIFSPNHFHQGGPTITTARQIPEIPIDGNIADQIVNKIPEIAVDNHVLAAEHGISIPARYLMHYWPEAKIVPIIFTYKTSPEEVEKLARAIINMTGDQQVLFVTSADFSHEEMALTGINNNQETIGTISNFDYEKLFSYKDDHTDSPAAIAALMQVAQKLNKPNFETWENSHGAILTNNPTLNGTSYVIGVFR